MLQEIQGIDIYLLDQIMKGSFDLNHKILDAGCGRARNMVWFAKNGFNIVGCDVNQHAIEEAISYTGLSSDLFKISALEKLLYPDQHFDYVICNAVLHFAENEAHFMKMVNELHRVLKPNGSLFIRTLSNFGVPKNYVDVSNGRYLLKEGYTRFLLTEKVLTNIKNEIGFEQIEPIKSVLVEDLRSMTTLVLAKK